MPSKKFISPEIRKNTIEELSKQLLKANSELHKLQEEREIMFANISHDLRAPMTAIRSALDLVLSEDKDDISREELISTLELIDRRSKTLESLINDMYYLYRVSSVTEEYHFEKIEVVPFLEEYYYDILADTKYDSFEIKLDIENIPEKTCIEIDTQKIVRVLDNLFTNAVKYSLKENEDGIENKQQIKLKARCNTETNELIISVIDNGPGIPEKNLPFVFMRTYMVSAARTPENGKTGSGLGLSIAKTIIEKHNGSIECISEINKWTEFIIRLPMCVK